MTTVGDILRLPDGREVEVTRVLGGRDIRSSDQIGHPDEESSAVSRDPIFSRNQERTRADYARRQGGQR